MSNLGSMEEKRASNRERRKGRKDERKIEWEKKCKFPYVSTIFHSFFSLYLSFALFAVDIKLEIKTFPPSFFALSPSQGEILANEKFP